jgi:polysaccharide biosynthesis protein PslG
MNFRPGLITALLAAWFVAAALAPAATAKAPDDFVGIAADDVFAKGPGYREKNLAAQEKLGIGVIRQTFTWKQIEQPCGTFDFSRYDAYVLHLAKHHIRVLPVLFDPPSCHARHRGRAVCQPKDTSTYGRFAAAVVNRYGPNGTLWRSVPTVPKTPVKAIQNWNEPSLPLYACGKPRAKQYTALLKAGYKAIKAADPSVEVVSAGVPNSLLKSAVSLPKYLRGLYKSDADKYWDDLAINSYAKNRRELSSILRRVRRIQKRNGDGGTPIWITEIGWGDKGKKHRFVVGKRGQASRTRKAINFIRTHRGKLKLRGFVYFAWRDVKPYPPLFKNQWGLHTGLLTRKGKKKPAFKAFRRAVRKIH